MARGKKQAEQERKEASEVTALLVSCPVDDINALIRANSTLLGAHYPTSVIARWLSDVSRWRIKVALENSIRQEQT